VVERWGNQCCKNYLCLLASFPWWQGQRWFLKCWFTCHPPTQHGCWPEKVSLNSVTVKALDYKPIKSDSVSRSIQIPKTTKESPNKSSKNFIFGNFTRNSKTNTVYTLPEGLYAFLHASENTHTHTHTHTHTRLPTISNEKQELCENKKTHKSVFCLKWSGVITHK
jgi:hypothetical protein